MKKLTNDIAEKLAEKLRATVGIELETPINIKSVLRSQNILTVYRKLSNNAFGVSIKTHDKKKFILVNSCSTRGRQHFTIAHELYHLYYDENPKPHICVENGTDVSEKNADLFASAFLLPKLGLLKNIPENELVNNNISLATILRTEQLFQVSRKTLLVRLKSLNIINKKQFEDLSKINVKNSAREYGYDTSLYEYGNDGIVIGDFGERARVLYEQGKISEGHYLELMSILKNE